jgi:hypothetical protein
MLSVVFLDRAVSFNGERISKMATLRDTTRTNLDRQGFEGLDDDAKARYALPLRFTPGIGTTLIVIGLLLQSPIWLGSMAVVASIGAVLPGGMPIDLVYNLGVRQLLGTPRLPPTPKPRQFSYLLSACLLTASALSFNCKVPLLGLILGGIVVIGGAVLTTTLWCLGSWIYRMVLRHGATN